MVFCGEHDRRSDQASLVPSYPAVAFFNDFPHQDLLPVFCVSQGREYSSVLRMRHHTPTTPRRIALC